MTKMENFAWAMLFVLACAAAVAAVLWISDDEAMGSGDPPSPITIEKYGVEYVCYTGPQPTVTPAPTRVIAAGCAGDCDDQTYHGSQIVPDTHEGGWGDWEYIE